MIRRVFLLLWGARGKLRLAWSLVRDPRVPLWQKAIPFLPLIYILSPINLISFAIPIIGQIDDIMLVVLAINLLERTVDPAILADHTEHRR